MSSREIIEKIYSGLLAFGGFPRRKSLPIINSAGDKVSDLETLALGSQFKNKTERRHSVKDYALVALRTGDIVLLNTNLTGIIEINPNGAIWLSGMEGFISEPSNMPYTATTAYALSQLDVQGKTVADFGAGDGVQSLVANKLGASKVYALEARPNLLDGERNYSKHAEANGIDNDQIKYLCSKFEMKALEYVVPFDEIDTVVANLGQHDVADRRAVNKISKLPNVKKVVMGGYWTLPGGVKEKYSPRPVMEALQNIGFEIKDIYSVLPDDNYIQPTSFIAVRKNSP